MNTPIGTRRQRTLDAMGIDVWVRRDVAAAVAAPPSSRKPELSAPDRAPPVKVEETPPAIDAPATTWTAVAVANVLLLARLDTPHDRRFASDLVAAAAGYPDETPALVPFVPSRTSTDEMAAFARGQIDRRRAVCTIVSRSAAEALALTVDRSVEVGVTTVHGVHCLVIPEIPALRTKPEAKRNVWQALSRTR